MAPRRTFQPVITASKWETAWRATFEAAKRRRGSERVDDAETPRLSNGDAVAVVKAWSEQPATAGFPLWYHFAATAYGWDPVKSDRLNTTAKQREAMLDAVIARELWAATKLLARNLDDANVTGARLALDDSFDDPVFQAGVKAAVKADNGLRAAGRIPIGCRDPKTGKITGPVMKCRPGFTLEIIPGTPFYICRNKKTGEHEQPKWECEGDTVYLDDPITAVANSLARLALIVGFAYVVITSMADE